MHKQLSKFMVQLWQTHRGMAILFWVSTGWLLLALVGMAVDDRTVFGISTWAKSMKFAVSFMAYAPTLAWLFTFVTRGRRVFNGVLNGVAVTLLIEVLLTLVQAVRGEAMHFNMSTPLNSILWAAMGITVLIFFGFTIVGFIVVLRQQVGDRTLTHAIRWGFAIMVLGLGLGYLMIGPNTEQTAVLETGGQPNYIGAHTVGAADGGPGLPITGWSREHGDLRIAHFVGLHGLQVIPLVGWWLFKEGKRERSRFNTRQRLQIIWTSALAYTGVVLLVAWQALRGQSLIRPDALTLGLLGALVGVALLSLFFISGRNNLYEAAP